jgi:hypothetical protein
VQLIVQRLATMQAKANWLAREQTLLEVEQIRWQADRDRLGAELAALYGCEGDFDLEKLKCK